MIAILRRRTARTAGWSRRTALFSLVLLVVAIVAHRFAYIDTLAFRSVLAAVAGFALLALLVGAVAFHRIWEEGDLGARDLTVGVFVALLVLSPFALAVWLAFSLPRLADISTDLENPPLLAAASDERTTGMNAIASPTLETITLQTAAYPDVTGRRYDMASEQVLELVNGLIESRGWPVTGRRSAALGQPEATIELLATTPVLAFPADVAVRLTDEGASTYVDMRSASRYGEHDFGENARRIQAFLGELDVEVAKRAGVAPTSGE